MIVGFGHGKDLHRKTRGRYWIIGSRVSLDSVVLAFLQGLSPETIAAECFPTLTLEQVYGAIAFYLANRSEINTYLKQTDAEHQALWQATHNAAGKLTVGLLVNAFLR